METNTIYINGIEYINPQFQIENVYYFSNTNYLQCNVIINSETGINTLVEIELNNVALDFELLNGHIIQHFNNE